MRVSDLADGAGIDKLIRAHEGWVSALTVDVLKGRPVIVSGGADGTVRVSDLADGAGVDKLIRAHEGWVSALAVGVLEGRPVIVSGGGDDIVLVSDLAVGTIIGQPLRGHTGKISSLAVGALDGRAVIVSGGLDGTVRIWDFAGGQSGASVSAAMDRMRHVGRQNFFGEPLWTPKGREITAVAVGLLDGRPVIVSAGGDERVRVWELADGTPVKAHWCGRRDRAESTGVLAVGTSRISALAVKAVEGRSVIFTSDRDGAVRVWDLTDGTLLGGPLKGPWMREVGAFVTPFALGAVGGRSVIASSEVLTLRVWDLSHGTAIGKGLIALNLSALAVEAVSERLVVVSGNWDGTVERWDMTNGTRIGQPIEAHYGGVTALSVGALEERAVIASGGRDGTVRTWEIDGLPRSTINVGSPVNALALVPPSVLIAGCSEGLIVLKLLPRSHHTSFTGPC